ncbi:MAG TPA: M3 family metallopeptidase, partial [Jatrophihabitans sp.]|nr:M3 family metallopeptidase [Jatrophihabitans sp.]
MDEPLSLPADGWPDWLAGAVDGHLSAARATLERLKDGTRRGTDEVLELWNDADIALRGADSIAGLLNEVHPDPDVRALAETRSQEVDRLRTDRGLDRALFDVIAGTDAAGLDPEATRLRAHVLRDFRRSGVDRDELVRARLREISERLTVVEQDFARVIREDVRSIRIGPAALDGLPADFVEAHPVDADGLVTITTDYPDYLPFRTFARDADARRELTVAFLNRGWPDNDGILREMLDLRDEQALLLGYENWPAYDAEVKMVGTAEAIGDFIEKLADASDEAARRDLDVVMQRLRRDEPDAPTFDASHLAYYTELIRHENYDVDAQEVRRFFHFANVRRGLLDVTGRLFDVEYREVDVATWHEDVTAYDVFADGVRRGRIYLDLHPRAGKFKHAAQFDLVGGITGRRLPEGVLVCNFPRGLMEHQHVVTLFHEFGHLVHHVLGGRQRWARFSGVATEWDFVEAPSQMLEEWAWDADILRSFAVDAEGTPISPELVGRMRAAKDFGKGMFVRNQVFYTAVSYVLHRDRPTDLTQVVQELQARYDLVDYLEGT